VQDHLQGQLIILAALKFASTTSCLQKAISHRLTAVCWQSSVRLLTAYESSLRYSTLAARAGWRLHEAVFLPANCDI
jgi:hypothetical protein